MAVPFGTLVEGETFIDNPHLPEGFEITPQMLADPVVKFFLENFRPQRLDWNFNDYGLSFYPIDGFIGGDKFQCNFDHKDIKDIEEGDELYLKPLLPSDLSRKTLFPKEGENSGITGIVFRRNKDGSSYVISPSDNRMEDYYHSLHFIDEDRRGEFVNGVSKKTWLPHDLRQRVQSDTNDILKQ